MNVYEAKLKSPQPEMWSPCRVCLRLGLFVSGCGLFELMTVQRGWASASLCVFAVARGEACDASLHDAHVELNAKWSGQSFMILSRLVHVCLTFLVGWFGWWVGEFSNLCRCLIDLSAINVVVLVFQVLGEQ
jgi:hypothetical protein